MIRMKRFLTLLVILLQINLSFAQADSLAVRNRKAKNNRLLRQSIIPLSLIGTGLIINYSGGSIGKENIQESIQNSLDDFHTSADDYLLFAPVVIMYGADLLKIPAKNDAFTQTKYLVIAGLANNLITAGLKYATDETRPNGEPHSFPSGHTSNAFVMARVLHREFADSEPLLAYSGYLFATATGVLRVLNNKHWVSDVLVGARIGILVTDIVYHFEPLKNWNPLRNKEKQALIIAPTFYENKFGLYANIRF
jgi:membrane-associated phospholipid phosphatase